MEKAFNMILNKMFKKDLELLYGIGTYVDVTEIKTHHQEKHHLLTCKLFVGDLNLFKEIGDEGLKYLLDKLKKITGYGDENFVCIISYDII